MIKTARYSFLEAQNAALITSALERDATALGWILKSPSMVFERFAALDPTAARKQKPFTYLNWLIVNYLKLCRDGTPWLAEDFSKITQYLTIFEKHKPHLPREERDINKYTFRSLETKARDLEDITVESANELKRQARAEIDRQTTILYDGEEGMIVVPHSRHAAEFWSKGTTWCTGAMEAQNFFHHYNLQSPLAILIPAHGGNRYQAHRAGGFKNEIDKDADPSLVPLAGRLSARFFPRAETDVPLLERPRDIDWSDRESVLAAVKQCGTWLIYAIGDFSKDREIGLEAVRQSGQALELLDESLRNDPEIVLAAVTRAGWALQYASKELRANRDIVLAAVKHNGRALRFADLDLRADREIVLAAVAQDGTAIQCADKNLRKDRDIVLTAVTQSGAAFAYADADLRIDPEFVLEAVTRNGEALEYAAGDLRKNREIVLAAVKQNGMALQYADKSLHGDPEIVVAALLSSLKYEKKISRGMLNAIDPLVLKQAWLNMARSDWQAIGYAADCDVALTREMEMKFFTMACANGSSDGLLNGFHLFPSLREIALQRDLTLDEAKNVMASKCPNIYAANCNHAEPRVA